MENIKIVRVLLKQPKLQYITSKWPAGIKKSDTIIYPVKQKWYPTVNLSAYENFYFGGYIQYKTCKCFKTWN